VRAIQAFSRVKALDEINKHDNSKPKEIFIKIHSKVLTFLFRNLKESKKMRVDETRKNIKS